MGLGALLIVAGLLLSVLSFVPLESQRTESTASAPGWDCTVRACFETDSVLVPQIITVSWSAASPPGNPAAVTALELLDCGSTEPPANGSAGSLPCGFLWGAILNATSSGSESFLVPGGHWLILGVVGSTASTPVNVTFSVSGSLPLAGTVLWALGVILLLVGLVARPRRPYSPVVPPAPWGAPPPPAGAPPPVSPGPWGGGPPPQP